MSDKKHAAILDRMQQAIDDERANGRMITQWRVSTEVKVVIQANDIVRQTVHRMSGQPVWTYVPFPTKDEIHCITDWYGETFEYDTAPLNTSA